MSETERDRERQRERQAEREAEKERACLCIREKLMCLWTMQASPSGSNDTCI